MKFIKICLITLLSIAIVSCGFTLRGSQALPASINTVIISSPVQFAPITRALKERLPVYQLSGITIDQAAKMTFPKGSTISMRIQPEKMERRLLSIFSNGQVAEYELIYSVDYQVYFPDKEAIEHTITVAREYQEDPDKILAKSRELEEIMQEMRRETADRMIRLLSSQLATSVEKQEP